MILAKNKTRRFRLWCAYAWCMG